MTATAAIALAIILLMWVLAVLSRRGGKRAAWLQREQMPEDLKTARLIASEKRFRCENPIALNGRPDQVYRLADGTIVIVDTKRRQRPAVYEADIAQASIYRLLLASQKQFRNQPFADYGYIRLVGPYKAVSYQRITLWPAEQVVALHRRYWALREGQAAPNGAATAGLCRQCGHRRRCKQARG